MPFIKIFQRFFPDSDLNVISDHILLISVLFKKTRSIHYL
jgi:hypothetical protein